MNIKMIKDLQKVKDDYTLKNSNYKHHILVCGGGGCISTNCEQTKNAIVDCIAEHDLNEKVKISFTGCMGTCAVGPVILIEPEGIFYTQVSARKAYEIVEAHILNGRIIEEYTFYDNNLQRHIPKMAEIPSLSAPAR